MSPFRMQLIIADLVWLEILQRMTNWDLITPAVLIVLVGGQGWRLDEFLRRRREERERND